MCRHAVTIAFLLSAVVVGGCVAAGDNSTTATRPNILVILTDNQSPSLLGAYGNRDIQTPNIDRLAQQGVLFENAYAASGVCSPTRASILSGLLPSQHGIHNALPTDPTRIGITDWSPLAEFDTLPQLLGNAGYETALVGKYHLGTHHSPQLGFQHWVTMETGHTKSFTDTHVINNGKRVHVTSHITDYWTDEAIRFLQQRNHSQPFFLLLAYNGPYMLPPVVTGPSDSRFADQYRAPMASFPQLPVHKFLRNWAIDSKPSDHMQAESTHAWAAINALNNPRAIINTAAETTHVDAEIGRLLESLRDLGLDKNTLIIFTSDQGSSYGQHGLWGNTSWAYPFPSYDSHLKIPLILHRPGVVSAGQRSSSPVSQIDLFPTLLDFAGVAADQDSSITGRSLRAALTGNLQLEEKPVIFEFITVRGVRVDQWKLVRRFPDGPDELYDLSDDPAENHNLIQHPEFQAIRDDLARRMDRFFEQHADRRFDLWHGGTGKGRLLGDYGKNSIFKTRFPDWREPYIE